MKTGMSLRRYGLFRLIMVRALYLIPFCVHPAGDLHGSECSLLILGWKEEQS